MGAQMPFGQSNEGALTSRRATPLGSLVHGVLLVLALIGQAGCVSYFVGSQATAYTEKFNRRDVRGVADTFTNDTVMIGPSGERMVGPEAVVAYYKRIFARMPDLQLQFIEVTDVTSISDGWQTTIVLRATGGGKSALITSTIKSRKDRGEYRVYETRWVSSLKLTEDDLPSVSSEGSVGCIANSDCRAGRVCRDGACADQ